MKILHCNIVSSGGGLEQYLGQLFEELSTRRYRNLFLYGENTGEISLPSDAKQFYIERITHPRCHNLSAKLASVREIIIREDPDLVFIHQVINPSLIDLLTRTKPSVRFMHAFKIVCPEGKKLLRTRLAICPYSLRWLCQTRAYLYQCMPRNPFQGLQLILHSRKILHMHRQRSFMVVASEFMKAVLLYNGFNPQMIRIIPYFTYLPDFQTEVPPDDEPVILALGRIVYEKGMHHLVRAFANLNKPAKLIIAGDGPAMNDLKTLAERLGVSARVSFPGWLSHEKLHSYYRKSSLVVVPSLWPEPFGIVGIEAMAFGRPVVAFDVGGISDWLKDGVTGFLVSPGDERGLVERINLLLERPEMVEEMGRSARQMVEESLTPELHLERLTRLFQETIDSFSQKI